MSAKDSITSGGSVEKYGCLTVLSKRRVRNRMMCLCLCDCGQKKEAREDRIKSGRIVSCGCKRSRIGGTHGHCRHDRNNSRAYRAWASMLSRCNNPHHKSYPGYGGRGIRVCERWTGRDGYPNFLADMGNPGQDQSLDRKDNNGNYEPENCRWTDRKTQQRNTRRNRLITYNGRTQALAAWAEEFSLEYMTISCRLARGWSVERALTTPSLMPQMKGIKRKKFGGP